MAGVISSFEDVAKNFNISNTAINARPKSVTINGTVKSTASGTVNVGAVVTSVKINGSTVEPVEGMVDLGAFTVEPSTTAVIEPN